MDFKTLHEEWKTLSPGPFTDPENEIGYQEFLKIKEQGDVHVHNYTKGDNPDDKKKREKDATKKAKEGESKAKEGEAKVKDDGEANGNGEAKANGNGEAKANGNGEEKKKLDPVGKEDGDIDNDGDQDKSDKYLAKKRKAIGKSIKSQKKTKAEKPIKMSGEKEKIQIHKGQADEEVELDEAAVKAKLRDLSAELAAYARKHRGDIDKLYFEKIAQIAAAGKMPSAKDIDTETDPRDFVLDMMAKSFPPEIMKNYKGISPGLDKSLQKESSARRARSEKDAVNTVSKADLKKIGKIRKLLAKQPKPKEQKGLYYARHGEEVEMEEAVLVNRDYKYDGKKIHISKKNFKKVHNDYKNSTPGRERMITYDSKWGTVSVPVEFTEEANLSERSKLGAAVAGSMKGQIIPFHTLLNTPKGWESELGYTDAKGTRNVVKKVKGEISKAGVRKVLDDIRNKYSVEEEVEDKKKKKKPTITIRREKETADSWRKAGKSLGISDLLTRSLGSAGTAVEEVEEASTYTDREKEEKEKKKKHFAFGGKKKSRHGESGYAKGEEVEKEGRKINELTSRLMVRAWQKSKVKADDAIKKRVRGDHSIYKSAGEVIKRSKQGSKFYKAAIDKRMKEKKKVEEESEWAKSKRLDKEVADKYEKIHQERDKRYKSQRRKQEKKEETDVDEMSAMQQTSLNIHNTRVKLGVIKPGTKKIKKKESGVQTAAKKAGMSSTERSNLYNDNDSIDEMSAERLARAARKAEVQGREPGQERGGTGAGYGKRDPKIRQKRRNQSVKFSTAFAKKYFEKEEVNTGNNRLKSLEKDIDKLHSRTKHMKHLKGKERDQMRDLSRQRDELLKARSIPGQNEESISEKRSATGYELYHKDFSSAMQHAYDHAETKGFIVDPKEIDDKVATGPKKPSNGKTNRYILGTNGRKKVHIQVANLDNKRYELNMYIEELQYEEDIKSRISNSPLVNKLYLMNQAKAIAKEKKGPDKTHKIDQWEDLAKKMGFDRRDYEEFGDTQGMYESTIPQEKGDMATKARLKLEKILGNRKFVEPKESERAGEEGTDKLSDNYKEATPGQTVKEGNIIVNDRDPYRIFEHMVHYVMGTSIKNIEDYTFYRIEETPHNLRLENKEGAIATITLADVQSFYDDQDMLMDEFIEMITGFGVKELTEKGNSIVGDEGVPAIGKDRTGQGIYTTDPPKTFENIDIYSKFIQSNEERQKKGFVVN